MTDTARSSRFRRLYGPVPSRRLGRSLGIDLVPHKVCTYDCIYCQIGKTSQLTLTRKEYVPSGEILDEVGAFLSKDHPPIDYFSLSGSGEPTLHSRIRWIIEEIKKMTRAPVAVLTNGSLFYLEEVRQDLLSADVVLPSLDAVSAEAFERINRPAAGFTVDRVIEGLVEFRKIYRGQLWLEVLFCRGVNDTQPELSRLKQVLERVQPDQVHLNTVVRPPSEAWAIALTPEEMERVKAFLGAKASIVSEFDRHLLPASAEERRAAIVRILKRRPLSMRDISQWLRVPQEELGEEMEVLVREGRVLSRDHGGAVFYEMADRSGGR